MSAAGGQEGTEERRRRREPAHWVRGAEGELERGFLKLSSASHLQLGPGCRQVEANRCSRVHRVGEQAASSVYIDSRSVTLRRTLAPGRYVLLPTTFLPGTAGRFLLRLFSCSCVQLRLGSIASSQLIGPNVRDRLRPSSAAATFGFLFGMRLNPLTTITADTVTLEYRNHPTTKTVGS